MESDPNEITMAAWRRESSYDAWRNKKKHMPTKQLSLSDICVGCASIADRVPALHQDWIHTRCLLDFQITGYGHSFMSEHIYLDFYMDLSMELVLIWNVIILYKRKYEIPFLI